LAFLSVVQGMKNLLVIFKNDQKICEILFEQNSMTKIFFLNLQN
jgi:hypothetical protein